MPDVPTPIPPPVPPARGAARAPSDAAKIIGGLVTQVSGDEVELTTDDGRPAVISRRNFDDADTDPSSILSIGDRVEGALLSREDPKGRLVLSRAWALKKRAWEQVVGAAERNELISGTVVSVSKRGVVVDAGVRGFVPSTHLVLEPPSDLRPFVGQSFDFRVLEVDVAKERLVLSRRSLLLKEQRKQVHDVLSGLDVGSTRSGSVSSLTDFGAFVDLGGGVKGLVHLSELSWHHVRHPSEVVEVGDEVEVKILDVKVKKRRVSLSMRRVAPDPLAGIEVGSILEGPICRLVDFGAFVDIGGSEGLVHLSELAEHRVSAPEELVAPGEIVRVKVLSVDRKRRRIELSIRQAVSSAYD